MSTTWGVSLDLLEAWQGRKWRLGEVKSPAPGAGPGGASQTTLIPVTEPCSSRERVALGLFRNSSGTKPPETLRGYNSHAALTLLDLNLSPAEPPDQHVIPSPGAQRSRPTWEGLPGTTRETHRHPVNQNLRPLWPCISNQGNTEPHSLAARGGELCL